MDFNLAATSYVPSIAFVITIARAIAMTNVKNHSATKAAVDRVKQELEQDDSLPGELPDWRVSHHRFAIKFSKQLHRSSAKSRIISRPDTPVREPAFPVIKNDVGWITDACLRQAPHAPL
ncbi:hypothetical protein [Burkholderia sp. LMG 21824]|uniref:hypothetical protein n=1 Tax=Burkholderia sp. LMG 21824 TaxID=3158172 RepID=UPI003C2BCF6B